jgi:hypothetical protein
MAKHTPGKWIVDTPDNDDFGAPQNDGSKAILRLHIAHNVTGGRIGAVFRNCLVTSEAEMFANAAVFAAAPQMLAALQQVARQSGTGIREDDTWKNVFAAIRAATPE